MTTRQWATDLHLFHAPVHSPRPPKPVHLSTAILATIPLFLAAITVWMVRDALTKPDRRSTPASLQASPPPAIPTR